jgi:hypothetical protein
MIFVFVLINMAHTLETLNKDLYPWFFKYLGPFDAYMFACSTPYAYNAFLKFVRVLITGFDIEDYSDHTKISLQDAHMRMKTRFNQCNYESEMRPYVWDLISVVCRSNTSSRLLDGMMRLVVQPTRDFALTMCVRVRCPNNVKVMLKWADPMCMIAKQQDNTCTCKYTEIIATLLKYPRLHDRIYRMSACSLHAQVISTLLCDKRCHVNMHYAMFLAIEYNNIDAFQLTLHDTTICMHVPFDLFIYASDKNYYKFIEVMIPHVRTLDIKGLMSIGCTSTITQILQSELKKRKNI